MSSLMMGRRCRVLQLAVVRRRALRRWVVLQARADWLVASHRVMGLSSLVSSKTVVPVGHKGGSRCVRLFVGRFRDVGRVRTSSPVDDFKMTCWGETGQRGVQQPWPPGGTFLALSCTLSRLHYWSLTSSCDSFVQSRTSDAHYAGVHTEPVLEEWLVTWDVVHSSIPELVISLQDHTLGDDTAS